MYLRLNSRLKFQGVNTFAKDAINPFTKSRNYLMLYGGFATGAFGLVSKTEIFTSLEQNFLISLHERAFMTLGVATASIIGGHLLVIANQVCYAHFLIF